jgi:CRISPR-associated protein Cas5h
VAGDRRMEAGIAADISFDLAHFRVHTTMKGRSSYLIPLPTTVIGFFFSILGKSREEYIEKRKQFKAGAQIIDFKGICRENAQLIKLKSRKEVRTTEELTLLLRPKYRFALWGDHGTIDSLYKRIETFEFEFVPYGGISDFIFSEVNGLTFHTYFEEVDIISNSYVPKTLLDSLELEEGSLVCSLPYTYSGRKQFVVMGLNVKLKLTKKVKTIGGVPLHDCFFGEI